MNNSDTKTIKKEVEGKLTKYTTEFQGLEACGFEADLKKGELLLAAQSETNCLNDQGKCWSRWVTQDLGLALRTAQRYRDVASFYGNPPEGIPSLNAKYCSELGMTKLDLITQLWNAQRKDRFKANVEFHANRVTIIKKSDKTQHDAADVTVRELRKLTLGRERTPSDTPTKNQLQKKLDDALASVEQWKVRHAAAVAECEELKAQLAALSNLNFTGETVEEAA